jgi:hypothetical protein
MRDMKQCEGEKRLEDPNRVTKLEPAAKAQSMGWGEGTMLVEG